MSTRPPLAARATPVLLADLYHERPAAGARIDPVCRMRVKPAARAGMLEHRGSEYNFCSLECAAFARDPERFVNQEVTSP